MSTSLVMADDRGRFDEQEHEFYCWAADPDEEGQRSQWFVRDAADDRIVAGPFDIDACIRKSARLNRELEEE